MSRPGRRYAGRVAAITGAGSGIGRALAHRLAGHGCHLALSDVNGEALATVAAELAESGVRVTTAVVDVADKQQVASWAEAVADEHGAVHFIFNNAGVALGSPIDGMSDDDLRWLMDINFWGVVYGTQAFLPHLKAAGDGHVVNISSIFGLIGVPSQGAYNAAKFAVRGYTEALRQELDMADCGVSATTVHPGGIKTNIAQAARFADNMDGIAPDGAEAGKKRFERLFITTPESAADTILRGVARNARRVLIGPDAYAVDAMQRLLPTGYQRLVGSATRRLMQRG
ncbi:SDR family NAD(P)-dependent oxidoreductase [Algiphilus sp.]|uniref:SDR family NAD(P)-dependent oxidoreductase n=1 Tax=Algiphilus sp. TaxID=1872431 RepID=UPI003C6A0B15